MANIDVNALLAEMVGAAQKSFKGKWPKVKDLGTNSLKKLAQILADIQQMKSEGIISQEQAKLLFEMEKNTFKIVMLSIEIIGIVAVEDALNAALNVVKKAVNKALGFVLI